MFYDFASLKAEKYDRFEDMNFDGGVDSKTVEISTESFHKIIDELLDNAFRFSEKGTKVNIKTWLQEEFLYFIIEDSGRGMNSEQISGVAALAQFERTIYEQQGVGLGLVISKRLTELHDGVFEIVSEEGVGTKITFSLPCVIE
jgi:signal transduction histidine kinase